VADILPPSTDERVDPWSLVDGCPECVDNTEAPWHVATIDTGGWLCAYYCADCRHSWSTSWGR
jgi:hypothetical protein